MTTCDSKIKGSFIIFVLDNHGILPSKINRRLPHLHINNMHLHNNTSLCNFFTFIPSMVNLERWKLDSCVPKMVNHDSKAMYTETI